MRIVTAGVALLALCCMFAEAGSAEPAEGMSQDGLADVIRSIDSNATGSGRVLEFSFGQVRMASVSDGVHGRMRIVAPVGPLAELTPAQVVAILDANYHTTLDARYGSSEGVLYAAFIHPLAPLTVEQVRSAVRQVASLVKTFGTTFSSGELSYGNQGQAL